MAVFSLVMESGGTKPPCCGSPFLAVQLAAAFAAAVLAKLDAASFHIHSDHHDSRNNKMVMVKF